VAVERQDDMFGGRLLSFSLLCFIAACGSDVGSGAARFCDYPKIAKKSVEDQTAVYGTVRTVAKGAFARLITSISTRSTAK
jgi:hypothetical protein